MQGSLMYNNTLNHIENVLLYRIDRHLDYFGLPMEDDMCHHTWRVNSLSTINRRPTAICVFILLLHLLISFRPVICL